MTLTSEQRQDIIHELWSLRIKLLTATKHNYTHSDELRRFTFTMWIEDGHEGPSFEFDVACAPYSFPDHYWEIARMHALHSYLYKLVPEPRTLPDK